MPDPNAKATNSIGVTIDQTIGFIRNELSVKKEELEKIVAELESRLGGVLKTAKGDEAKLRTEAAAILRNSDDSPFYNMVQDLKSDVVAVRDHYEVIRNRISGLIDRIHI